jgi:glycosyltransferase involved in cell wall biosynthesis
MAEATVCAYRKAMARGRTASRLTPKRARVFQIMEALQDRDAVSTIARNNSRILEEAGVERPILALFAEESVLHETGRIKGVRFGPDDAAIVHYWGYSWIERVMSGFRGRKAIHYHNITPPHFFPQRSGLYEMTRRGYAQLARISNCWDLVIGDSHFNLSEFATRLTQPTPTVCAYPLVEPENMQAAPWDAELANSLADGKNGPLWLFVGRFAPNKRQDLVMRAFDAFVSMTGRGTLALVGNVEALPPYTRYLGELRRSLRHGARIRFVPLVSDAELRAYYRAAALFACASEHEGFCLPVAEAMAFDVPVIALDRGGVRESLGSEGVLMREWNPARVGALAADLLESPGRRAEVVSVQRNRLTAFSRTALQSRMRAIVGFLLRGERSEFITPPTTHAEASYGAPGVYH